MITPQFKAQQRVLVSLRVKAHVLIKAYKTPDDLDPSTRLCPHPLLVCPVHAQPSLATLASLRFLRILKCVIFAKQEIDVSECTSPSCLQWPQENPV